MFVLHPYSEDRPAEKAETWAFINELKKVGVRVVDLPVERETYPDEVGKFWGLEEMVLLEDDKVPTTKDFQEVAACPEKFCIFPYPFSYRKETTLNDWLPPTKFPYGLGFVKFSLEAQKGVPFKDWDRTFRNNEFDKIIEVPMIAKYGPMHIHPTIIAHNHAPKIREVVGDKILYFVPGRKVPRFLQRFR